MSGVPVEGTGICTEDGLLANYWVGTFKQPIRPSNGRQSGHSATDIQFSIFIRYRAGKGPARYYALEPFRFVEGTDCLAILVLDEQFGAKTGDRVLRCAVVGDGGPERFIPDKRAFVRPFSFIDASVLLEISASAIQSVAGKKPVQMCDMSELSSSWVLLK
ncbi:hypothetical protein BN946_scf184569.g59 [Trametes cinnabarina]|uniref:Uncharacterized protein n=1 Tax=Pycnoporus cinnabarinus TaxID=5643 RepID=A0A060S8E5_PYCCI|nr:hypothetical protein BN946_scf184569.g59 [Trametes cinnabarina]